jgi:hypothetical protein
MKRVVLLGMFLLYGAFSYPQEENEILLQQQAELEMERTGEMADDDSYGQELEFLRKHPLHLNTVGAEELRNLRLLTELQLNSFLQYRLLLGPFISIYELQSVPGWDLNTIRSILPFVVLADAESSSRSLFYKKWKHGNHILLTRWERTIRKNDSVDDEQSLLGSPWAIQLRYKYQYKNLLQWGVLADKDAGEPAFRHGIQQGFDFYSFHFFARKIGRFKSIAIGDFTLNLGQGLMQWQNLAFKKSVLALQVKRQGSMLKPYHSGGQFNFHRGIAVNWQKGKWELLLFASLRSLGANLKSDSTDSSRIYISSLWQSGYFRTDNELMKRDKARMLVAGSSVRYNMPKGYLALNTIAYHFSLPFLKEPEPYNLFSFRGRQLMNIGVDYGLTYRNVHVFGETAMDSKGGFATINGFLASLHSSFDLAVLHRSVGRSYQSFFSNAFTESNSPINERGLYVGISLKPGSAWQLNAFLDVYKFPWLKFRVNSPAAGREYLLQVTYSPHRQIAVSTRFRSEHQPFNYYSTDSNFAFPSSLRRKNWRLDIRQDWQKNFRFNYRVEMRTDAVEQGDGHTDFYGFAEFGYRVQKPGMSAQFRWLYFETGTFGNRLYISEGGLPYTYGTQQLRGRGHRWYVNFLWKARVPNQFAKKIDMIVAFKIAQTIVFERETSVTSLQRTSYSKSMDFGLQLMLNRLQ